METKIIWKVDPNIFPYLRERTEHYCNFAVKPPKEFRTNYAASFKDWILSRDIYCWLLAGYAEVDKGRDTHRSRGYFKRRVWWLKHTDLDPGGCPCEAVIPSSIGLNKPSSHYPDGRMVRDND